MPNSLYILSEYQQGTSETPDNLASRMNLIALDSPFFTEPVIADQELAPAPSQSAASQMDSISEEEFEKAWGSIVGAKTSARGWCDSTPAEVFKHIRGSSYPFRLGPSEEGARL